MGEVKMAERPSLTGDYLLEKGLITEQQLREAVDEHMRTNRKVEDILIKRGYAQEEDIAYALSEKLEFPFIDLSSYQIAPDALALVGPQIVSRLGVIPLFKIGNSLTVAMTNPLDVEAIDELSRLAGGLRIKPIIATPSGIKEAISKYYGTEAPALTRPMAAAQQPQGEPARLIQEATQAPVINLVNRIIEDAVRMGASDIHIEPQGNTYNCRFRVDGILREAEPLPQKFQLAIVSRIKVMAEIDIAQNRLPQDGRIEKSVLGRAVDLRVATFPTIYGEHLSLRILDKTQGILKLEQLGFHEDMLKKFKEVIYKPYGIILVTGPTGSGKTTTLYSILNTINDLKKNIVTLEDPVEYTIPRVNQAQVNIKAGLTFAMGLRSILRLDPDIIMIGEIRDKDTADIAIHSSLTGHLVFSTLHTNDAPSAATRLIDIGVEPYLVASSLMAVLAQRLVRKLCPKCRAKYKPSEEELALIGKLAGHVRKEGALYKPAGCKECQNTGYKGRIGIFELLIPDDNIEGLMLRKSPDYEVRAAAQKAGMKTLREDGIEKVIRGITTLSEVLRVTEEI